MNTVGEKWGYAFWYLMIACSLCALINSLYHYLN